MKYQIILESEEQLTDQEVEDWTKERIYELTCFTDISKPIKVIEARSLEGIREELWKKRDTVIDSILHAKEPSEVIETTFEEIEELFKI